jgi:hypothetical protein
MKRGRKREEILLTLAASISAIRFPKCSKMMDIEEAMLLGERARLLSRLDDEFSLLTIGLRDEIRCED